MSQGYELKLSQQISSGNSAALGLSLETSRSYLLAVNATTANSHADADNDRCKLVRDSDSSVVFQNVYVTALNGYVFRAPSNVSYKLYIDYLGSDTIIQFYGWVN